MLLGYRVDCFIRIWCCRAVLLSLGYPHVRGVQFISPFVVPACPPDVSITEARGGGGGGNPRGLTVYVVPGPRDGLVRPDLGPHPGRPVAM